MLYRKRVVIVGNPFFICILPQTLTHKTMIAVFAIARKDITEHFKETGHYNKNRPGEVWNVTCNFIFTKEQKKLNRLLGIHKLNKSENILNLKK